MNQLLKQADIPIVSTKKGINTKELEAELLSDQKPKDKTMDFVKLLKKGYNVQQIKYKWAGDTQDKDNKVLSESHAMQDSFWKDQPELV